MPRNRIRKSLGDTFLMLAVLGLSSPSAFAQGAFAVVPTWDGIAVCSGKPITSPSPGFSVSGVPAGTTELEFRMTDLDAPRFTHGGGKVGFTGQQTIAPGAFNFIGPCPPSKHRYEWTVTARDAAGKSLGVTRAVKTYP
jgi:phosphatidylethanolamine-binding protein (PEBP) family uncharacterized protein